jgi:hypothetical protein
MGGLFLSFGVCVTVGTAAARPLNELNRQPNLVQEFVKNN